MAPIWEVIWHTAPDSVALGKMVPFHSIILAAFGAAAELRAVARPIFDR